MSDVFYLIGRSERSIFALIPSFKKTHPMTPPRRMNLDSPPRLGFFDGRSSHHGYLITWPAVVRESEASQAKVPWQPWITLDSIFNSLQQ